MPLSPSPDREEVHHRNLSMRAYRRRDGLYDVEAHLEDRKPFDFQRPNGQVLPAGEPWHDLWVRLVLDDRFVVRAIEAASEVTPHAICKEAEATLQVLVGERVASGWSRLVKQRLRGAASCTHLMEMLIPLATAALQGIRALQGFPQPVDANGRPKKIDSCYAWAGHREVVKVKWPEHWRPAP
ncbi:MAG TPA: DUF2889 domain-containing protein [Ramlibacter sp.]|nr:DUF2889 domain-containing protein [Ramlibacter sp.]